jgi:hypothetical protein
VAWVLGIRFDIERLERVTGSPAYGPEAWKVFWEAVDPRQLSAARLRDGNTAATLSNQENVFCIEVQADPRAVQEAKRALAASSRFRDVSSSPPVVEADVPSPDPLVDAGWVADGQVTGGGWATGQVSAENSGDSGAATAPSAGVPPSTANVFAAPAEGRSDRPAGPLPGLRSRPRWALVSGLAALVLVLVGCAVAIPLLGESDHGHQPDPSSASQRDAPSPSGRPVHFVSLKTGECVSDPSLRDGTPELSPIIQLLPCGAEHDAEVFFVGDIWKPEQEYPGRGAVEGEWRRSCENAFRLYVGLKSGLSVLDFRGWSPSRGSWGDGDRRIGCMAYDPDRQLTGTVKDYRH